MKLLRFPGHSSKVTNARLEFFQILCEDEVARRRRRARVEEQATFEVSTSPPPSLIARACRPSRWTGLVVRGLGRRIASCRLRHRRGRWSALRVPARRRSRRGRHAARGRRITLKPRRDRRHGREPVVTHWPTPARRVIETSAEPQKRTTESYNSLFAVCEAGWLEKSTGNAGLTRTTVAPPDYAGWFGSNVW